MGVLHTTPIDEKDPRYIEYLKTTENPSWIGYENYCWELYKKEMDERLIKYAQRNEDFLNKVNHVETYIWLQNYIKNQPSSMHRKEVGDDYFEAHLRISAKYNSLIAELTRDELDENALNYFLNTVNDQKKIIDSYNK
jgi:hypothetical protein